MGDTNTLVHDDPFAAPQCGAAFTARVWHCLLATPGRLPDEQEAGRRLCVSTRTLRRRLAAERTSYQELLRAMRCRLAQQHLLDATLSVAAIARIAGYRDPANFRHAFVRWYGCPPSVYRQRLQGEPTLR